MSLRQKLVFGSVALVALVVTLGGIVMWKGHEILQAIEVSSVDLHQIKDGVYAGYCRTPLVSAAVQVVVANGKIDSIELLHHKHGRGKPAEAIVDKIVENQTLNVDVIAGATLSSKVILKAVENALER